MRKLTRMRMANCGHQGLKLDCGKELHDAADSAAEDNEQLPSTVCCARRRVTNEPDFLGQREWLREVVGAQDHVFP